ncbi:MAG: hypothetical protein ACLRJC_10755 [Emergencia timonensis]|uniref:hypothetical protein n=2 Tax=Emergencia timonensis TaxID=1776384 RepID=UPI000832555A|nr:hypothetical protein [Emergencia timonensis]WNX90017.1 hypothetical protein RVY71_06995 [Emergencia timonensis]
MNEIINSILKYTNIYSCIFVNLVILFMCYMLTKEDKNKDQHKKGWKLYVRAKIILFGQNSKNDINHILFFLLVSIPIALNAHHAVYLSSTVVVNDIFSQFNKDEILKFAFTVLLASGALIILINANNPKVYLPLYQQKEKDKFRKLFLFMFYTTSFISILYLCMELSGHTKWKGMFLLIMGVYYYFTIVSVLIIFYYFINDFFGSKENKILEHLFFWMKESVLTNSEKDITINREKETILFFVNQLNNITKDFDVDFSSAEVKFVDDFKSSDLQEKIISVAKKKWIILSIYSGVIITMVLVLLNIIFFDFHITYTIAVLLSLDVVIPFGFLICREKMKNFALVHFGKKIIYFSSGEKTYATGGWTAILFNSQFECYCWTIFNMVSLYLIKYHLSEGKKEFDFELWNQCVQKVKNDDTRAIILWLLKSLENKSTDDITGNPSIGSLAEAIKKLFFYKLEECNISKEEIFR